MSACYFMDKIVLGATELRDHDRQIEKIETVFENQLSIAEENVRNSFKVSKYQK